MSGFIAYNAQGQLVNNTKSLYHTPPQHICGGFKGGLESVGTLPQQGLPFTQFTGQNTCSIFVTTPTMQNQKVPPKGPVLN